MQLPNQMSTAWFNFRKIDWKKRLIYCFFLLFLGIVYVEVLLPIYHIRIPCLFTEITGLQDPGEGVTSAIYALLRLRFYQAFRFNMLIFILLPLYTLYFYFELAEMKMSANTVMAIMITLALLFGVLRNVPEFAWLKPIILR